MIIKGYIKQAWNLMKQNKLFTGIYVAGTGLAIAMTMTVFIVLYVNIVVYSLVRYIYSCKPCGQCTSSRCFAG